MTHEQFCFWLEGFFMRGGNPVTVKQWVEIGERLHKSLNPAVSVDAGKPERGDPSVWDKFAASGNSQQQGTIKFSRPERFSRIEKERTIEDYSRTVPLSHEDLFGEPEDQNSQNPRTMNDIADLRPGNIQYVPPFTPQAPFNGEGS